MSAKQTEAQKVGADFKVSTARAPQFTFAPDAKRASVPECGDTATVARGARADGTPWLVVQARGSKDFAVPVPAIGAAITQGVITLAELAYLLAPADLAKLAKMAPTE